MFISALIDQTIEIKEAENEYIEQKTQGKSDKVIKSSISQSNGYEELTAPSNSISTRNVAGVNMTSVNAGRLEVIDSTDEEIARFRQRMIEKGIDVSKSITW